jgi:hypothetical protein
MLNKLVKILSGGVLLFLSPFVIVGIFGGIYMTFQLLLGQSFSMSIDQLLIFGKKMTPYLPYLTFIPMTILTFVLGIKKFKSQ